MMIKTKEKKPPVKIDKEGIKKGYYIQPFQKDAFIKTYGYHPTETKEDVRKYLKGKGLEHKHNPDNPNNPEWKRQQKQ